MYLFKMYFDPFVVIRSQDRMWMRNEFWETVLDSFHMRAISSLLYRIKQCTQINLMIVDKLNQRP